MSIIQWDGSLAIGHAVIDGQHRGLIEVINRLHTVYSCGNGDDIRIVLLELYKYTLFHFGEEESLMAQIGYVESPSHKQEHERFIERLDALAVKAKAGDACINAELFNWLVAWLLDHISVTDRMLGAALAREEGLVHGEAHLPL